jgi:hypothetical protein
MTEQTKRRGRPRKMEPQVGTVEGQVDWEKLAKHLQEALESLIKENAAQEIENGQLARDNLKLIGVVGYLESKVARSDYSI